MKRKEFYVRKKMLGEWMYFGEFVGTLAVAKKIGYSPAKLAIKLENAKSYHGGYTVDVGNDKYIINVLP